MPIFRMKSALLIEWHSRGQRFDPAYLHHTEGRESLENTMFSRLFRFSSKIQKRIKKECYCILRCILFSA